MPLISFENFKRNFNIGWALLVVYLAAMSVVFLLAKPEMPLGTAMYLTALVLLLIGLALEG